MKILFMCVANSARSQMAEGWAHIILGPEVVVQSAGSKATSVNPFAIQAMREVGIDISKQSSKAVQTIDPKSVEIVITLCAEEVCPIYLGAAHRLHWPFNDPAGNGTDTEILGRFRSVRDQIGNRIKDWSAQGCPL
jgi:arsenate reductase